ncbi:hypothetical protein GGS21DRAFT_488895 [Xylaria nigripes]|nr:hypothetical protein GGS21DRAFT_488895 [Xylaria nigripes]
MEQTFMTIHNLSCDANILFASESVVDILGYQPHEIQGKSCFDYFHPDEIPFARSVHNRGVLLDKAAVLHYCRIMSKDGRWISCECCFTVVHDVLVACTSIYRRGQKSERRAIEAPQIRRIFSCSPRDPRYHMLEHLSPKFTMPSTEREPRAALILNRFTRTLSIMFATNAISSILGIGPDQLRGISLYECIAENGLADAIKCLERAKANDSIAYLRFWSRDPFTGEELIDGDVGMEGQDDGTSDNGSDGGTRLNDIMEAQPENETDHPIKREPTGSPQMSQALPLNGLAATIASQLHTMTTGAPRRIVAQQESRVPRICRREPIPTRELEAVVSCTSDGLVMVLRKARPPIPSLHPPMLLADYENGLFAAPWSEHPLRPNYPPELFYTFRPPLLPQYMPVREHIKAAGGPPNDQLMKSIREVAVFAWGLVGINGNLASYSRGNPGGESQPPNGIPIWNPNAPNTSYLGPEPPSRYQDNRLAEEHSADPHSMTHPLRIPGHTTRGGQCHAGLGLFNSINSGRPWPRPSTMSPSDPRPFSHVQQQPQYRTTGYKDRVPQSQWMGGTWTETSTSYANEGQIRSTQTYRFEGGPQNSSHMWK